MDVTFTLRLINQLTAPAREAKAALNDLVKTAGESAKTAGKSAAEAVTTSANATRDAARKTAEQTGRAAATKAKAAAKTAADAAKAPVSKASKEAAAAVKPADPALKPVVLPQPKPSIRDFLRDQGDTPAVINDPPAKEPAAKKQPKPETKPDTKLGLLSSLPDDAAGEAEKSVGLVGRTVAAAKARLATSVTEAISGRLEGIATDFVAGKLNSLFDPVRQQLDGLKEQFPAFAPAIEMVQGKFEGLAATVAGMATSAASKLSGGIASRAGAMAAGLIGLPGIVLGGAVLAMANWTRVKAFVTDMFGKLPQPVQQAMSKIGAILAATPLGTLAKGFDQFGSHVEKVFDTLVNGGEQRWDKLKQLLVDDPLQWVQGAWDGLKSYFSGLWDQIKNSPRAALAGMASSVGHALAAIPRALSNLSFDLADALGLDTSKIRPAVDDIYKAIAELPARLVNLGADIAGKIGSGDWAGAAATAAQAFGQAFVGALKLVGNVANALVEMVTGVDLYTAGTELAGKVVTGLGEIPGMISSLGTQIYDFFANINLAEAGKKIVDSLKAGIEAAWEGLIGWLKQKASAIGEAISSAIPKWAGGGGSPKTSGASSSGGSIPGRRGGGPVRAGQLYRVGEEGEELFVPGQDGSIINATDTRRLLAPAGLGLPASSPAPDLFGGDGGRRGGGVNMNVAGARQSSTVNHFSINVHGAPSDDPETFGRRMWDEIERSSRGSLNDGVDR